MIQSWRSPIVANLAAIAERAPEKSLGAFTLTVVLSWLRYGDHGVAGRFRAADGANRKIFRSVRGNACASLTPADLWERMFRHYGPGAILRCRIVLTRPQSKEQLQDPVNLCEQCPGSACGRSASGKWLTSFSARASIVSACR